MLPMKRIALVLFILLAVLAASPAEELSFAGQVGGIFLNYAPDDIYLRMGFGMYAPLGQNLAFHLGIGFALRTDETDSGAIVPKILIPSKLGLIFGFPVGVVSFHIGFGLTPLIKIDATVDPDVGYFFLGPYLLGEVRFHIHEQMAILVSAEQDLLIGGTNWINTATQLGAGMIFSIPSR